MSALNYFANLLGTTVPLLLAPADAPPQISGEVAALITQLRQEIHELRRAVRVVPLYEWGAAGDPRDGEVRAIGYQQVPDGRDGELGQRGFALRVRGTSMAGYRTRHAWISDSTGDGILDGAIVFANPDAGYGPGDAVIALVDGKGLVIKQVWQNERGIEILRSVPGSGEACQIQGSQYRFVAKVLFWLNLHDAGRPRE